MPMERSNLGSGTHSRTLQVDENHQKAEHNLSQDIEHIMSQKKDTQVRKKVILNNLAN